MHHSVATFKPLIAGEEEAEYDKEMGQLGEDDPEHIDRNMWVPEEEQDDNEVVFCLSDCVCENQVLLLHLYRISHLAL